MGEGAHPGSENSRSEAPASMAPVVISSSAAPAPGVGSLANTKNSPAATSSVVTRRSTLERMQHRRKNKWVYECSTRRAEGVERQYGSHGQGSEANRHMSER